MAQLENSSLVLTRNIECFDAKHLLVANPVRDDLVRELRGALADDSHITAWSYLYSHREFIAKQSLNQVDAVFTHHLQPGAPDQPTSAPDKAIIYFPKSKPEFVYQLANIVHVMEEGSEIYLVGDNKSGVKSCEKLIKPFCSPLQKVDAAKHCILYRTTIVAKPDNFDPEEWFKTFHISTRQGEQAVYSLPGVFNHGSLDVGTSVLLDAFPEKPKGKILDFGCGTGVIGVWLHYWNDGITITAADVNALALASTEKTFAHHGIEGHVVATDGLSAINRNFNQIVSNPPFHTGIKTDYKITEQFIAGAKSHLYPHGRLTMVANNFLRYPPLLEQHFGKFTLVKQARGFNVYQAIKLRG